MASAPFKRAVNSVTNGPRTQERDSRDRSERRPIDLEIVPEVTFDAWQRVHVDGITWCAWCGEPDTDGEFCSFSCLKEYWADVRGCGVDST